MHFYYLLPQVYGLVHYLLSFCFFIGSILSSLLEIKSPTQGLTLSLRELLPSKKWLDLISISWLVQGAGLFVIKHTIAMESFIFMIFLFVSINTTLQNWKIYLTSWSTLRKLYLPIYVYISKVSLKSNTTIIYGRGYNHSGIQIPTACLVVSSLCLNIVGIFLFISAPIISIGK